MQAAPDLTDHRCAASAPDGKGLFFGIKLASQGWLRPGAKVRLSLALPDGEPPLGVDAAFVRSDPDGDLFSFLNLQPGQFHRLQRFLKLRVQPERLLRDLAFSSVDRRQL